MSPGDPLGAVLGQLSGGAWREAAPFSLLAAASRCRLALKPLAGRQSRAWDASVGEGDAGASSSL